jgi:hypothetical protein
MANLERNSTTGRQFSAHHAGTKERSPEAPALDTWSRDKLYRRAVELDIDGRSKMTKAQLVYALRGR